MVEGGGGKREIEIVVGEGGGGKREREIVVGEGGGKPVNKTLRNPLFYGRLP